MLDAQGRHKFTKKALLELQRQRVERMRAEKKAGKKVIGLEKQEAKYKKMYDESVPKWLKDIEREILIENRIQSHGQMRITAV